MIYFSSNTSWPKIFTTQVSLFGLFLCNKIYLPYNNTRPRCKHSTSALKVFPNPSEIKSIHYCCVSVHKHHARAYEQTRTPQLPYLSHVFGYYGVSLFLLDVWFLSNYQKSSVKRQTQTAASHTRTLLHEFYVHIVPPSHCHNMSVPINAITTLFDYFSFALNCR